jgi:hypothetical protein
MISNASIGSIERRSPLGCLISMADRQGRLTAMSSLLAPPAIGDSSKMTATDASSCNTHYRVESSRGPVIAQQAM